MSDGQKSGVLNQLVYDLLYPALLGTFIVALLRFPPVWADNWSVQSHQPWGALFCVYFALQFVRFETKKHHGWLWVFGFAEILSMAAIFSALGYLENGPNKVSSPDYGTRLLMMVAILVPPVRRGITNDFTKMGCHFQALSAVGLLALFVWWMDGIPQGVAFFILAVLAFFYMLVLILAEAGCIKISAE